jgi:hypothetical protein
LRFHFAEEGFIFFDLNCHQQANQQTSTKSRNIDVTAVLLTLCRFQFWQASCICMPWLSHVTSKLFFLLFLFGGRSCGRESTIGAACLLQLPEWCNQVAWLGRLVGM